MVADHRLFKDPKQAVGMPEDDAATDTSSSWSMIALLKGILAKLTTGIAVTGAQADDAAFTVGTTKVDPVAGIYKSTRDAVDDGDAGALAMNQKRGLYVSPESPDGDSLVDDTNDRLNVGLIASQDGVDGGAGAVSAKTLRVTHASDDPQAALIGAVDETAPATDTASSGINGRLQRIAQRITSVIALVPAALTGAGNFKVALQERAYASTKTLTNASVSFSTSGENVVVAATASQTIRVFRLLLSAASPVTLTIKDAAGGTTLATIPLATNQMVGGDADPSEPLFVTASSGAFVISLDSAVAVKGFIQYIKS